MLFNPFLNYKFLNFFKSGLYIDYYLKKIVEIFVKNILIYSSLFFGEKFLIEFLTKKSIDNIILIFHKFNFGSFFQHYLFIYIIIFFFYSILFFEFYFIIFL